MLVLCHKKISRRTDTYHRLTIHFLIPQPLLGPFRVLDRLKYYKRLASHPQVLVRNDIQDLAKGSKLFTKCVLELWKLDFFIEVADVDRFGWWECRRRGCG